MKERKNILSKAKVFLQMLGFVPVRKQVMENALRMGQTAVYEYFCGVSPYHWAQENLHTPFKINREFSESSDYQKKSKNTFESQYLYFSRVQRMVGHCMVSWFFTNHQICCKNDLIYTGKH